MTQPPPAEPDPSHVHTEEDVPNRVKELPTNKGLINVLAGVAVLLGALALVVGLGFELEIIGLLLALVTLLAGITLIFMALGDERAGAALPICAAVVGLVCTLVILFAMSVDEDQEGDPDLLDATTAPLITPDVEPGEAFDGDADLGDVDD